jgi:hypothetical protein
MITNSTGMSGSAPPTFNHGNRDHLPHHMACQRNNPAQPHPLACRMEQIPHTGEREGTM